MEISSIYSKLWINVSFFFFPLCTSLVFDGSQTLSLANTNNARLHPN